MRSSGLKISTKQRSLFARAVEKRMAETAVEAISDEGLETLMQELEHVSKGYRDAVLEIQSLKSTCRAEARRREAIEVACMDLKNDNERLRKLYSESLTKLASQIRCYSKCQSLEEELKAADNKFIGFEDEHRKMIEELEREHEIKVHDVEKQIGCSLQRQAADKALINQLQQELVAHKTQIDMLHLRLAHATADINLKYHHEIQDLKDCILIEQEEKKELQKKLQNAETELLSVKTKQAEQQRESISIHHVETLKQKIMKLRKENESLKKQLLTSVT